MRRTPDTGTLCLSPLSHQLEMIERPAGIDVPKAVILPKFKEPRPQVVTKPDNAVIVPRRSPNPWFRLTIGRVTII